MKLATICTIATASLVSASGLWSPGEARAADRKSRHSEAAMQKRYRVYSGGQGTYYSGSTLNDPACGGSAPTDQSMAAAVPASSPARCGDWLHVHYNGKMVAVKVVDECATCDNDYSIDLTKGAFQELADLSVGVLKPIKYRVLN